jgi:Zn-dependent protease
MIEIQTLLIYAIPVLFAITVHETAHGWVASLLGDPAMCSFMYSNGK